MRLPLLIVFLSGFSFACIEPPPDDETNPNNVTSNSDANNSVSSNNSVTSNSHPNNNATNNTSANNTATNSEPNNQTNNTSNNETNNGTNNQTTEMYSVTLTPSTTVVGALDVPLYVVLEDEDLPMGNYALESNSAEQPVYIAMDSRAPNRLGFWIRWPDLGSPAPVTLNLVPNGEMFNRSTWSGYHAVWHMNGSPTTLVDSALNPSNLSFDDCMMNCWDSVALVGIAMKTKGYFAATTTSTINLANNWSVSMWVQPPSGAPLNSVDFFSMANGQDGRFSLGISSSYFTMKVGDSQTTYFGTLNPQTPVNDGWHHIAIRSIDGSLRASLNGGSFTFGAQELTSDIQGQVAVKLGDPNVAFSFDEVWIGNTSGENLNAIYRNQSQALPNPTNPLLINAQLNSPP